MRDARIDRRLTTLPPGLTACLQRIEAAGGRAWLVGGVVRDALLGVPATDWDLATTLGPKDLLAAFPDAGSRDAPLGAVTLRLDRAEVVITTLREEGDYRDHRRPHWVRFVAEPDRDARRRDFTVNAIYVDPRTGELIDPVGGLRDLRLGVLRVIGDARERLTEDPLRILRAVRFAARCGLGIDAAARVAIAASLPVLRTLSAERVFGELTGAFTGPGRGRALRLLIELGVAVAVLPEALAVCGVAQSPDYHPEGDVLTHICLVLDHAVAGDPVQAWSAVLHDLGKPLTFWRAPDRIRFHGHDTLSARMADEILRRLRAPNDLRETVVDVVRDHIRFAALGEMARAKRERWLRDPRFPAHLAFHRADCSGSHGDLSVYEYARRALEELPPLPPPPLCTGKDVLALGVPQGPLVGELLRQLEDRLAAVESADRAHALAQLADIARPYVKAGS